MRRMHEATSDLGHQDASVVPGGAAYLHDRERRLAPYCERAEPRPRVRASLRGLLSPAERKTSWPLAEISGDAIPDGFQPLLRRALGDPEAVREERRRYVLPHLGDLEAVLGLDDTGVRNKGRHSAGVARPYSGTAGKVDNGQIGVCLGSARPLGHALVDRELARPQEWTDDCERWRQACPPAGSRATASRAMTAAGGCGWRLSPRPMGWPCRAKHRSGRRGSHGGSTPA
jgi:hypothetical protein